VTAYDRELNQIWQHTERRAKDFFGHYIYPIDSTAMASTNAVSHLCLVPRARRSGTTNAMFDDNHDHMDAMEFFDIDGDGKLELVTGKATWARWLTAR